MSSDFFCFLNSFFSLPGPIRGRALGREVAPLVPAVRLTVAWFVQLEVFHHRRDLPAELLLGLAPGLLVLFEDQLLELAALLEVALEAARVERAVGDRLPHGAARLVPVAAVLEPAARRQLLDVTERPEEALLTGPQLELAHARRIDQQSASRQGDELPPRCRVSAPAVLFADRRRRQSLGADQPVDDRRLAGARGAEEGRGLPGTEAARQCLEVRPVAGAHGQDRGSQGYHFNLSHGPLDV